MSTTDLGPSTPAHADPPTHDTLAAHAVTNLSLWLGEFAEQYGRLSANPNQWPELAAWCDVLGRRLASQGADLAAALAAFARAHPHVTVPDDGIGLQILDADQHADFWDRAAELANPHGTRIKDDTWPSVDDYARAATEIYGHPRYDLRAVALSLYAGQPDCPQNTGAVLLLAHLPGQPDQIVRAYAGGVDPEDNLERAGLDRGLAELGITIAPPRFWPPLHELGTSIQLRHVVFDQYGRFVSDPNDPARPAAGRRRSSLAGLPALDANDEDDDR